MASTSPPPDLDAVLDDALGDFDAPLAALSTPAPAPDPPPARAPAPGRSRGRGLPALPPRRRSSASARPAGPPPPTSASPFNFAAAATGAGGGRSMTGTAAAAAPPNPASRALPPHLGPADLAALTQLMAELGRGEEGGGDAPASSAAATLAALAGAAPSRAGGEGEEGGLPSTPVDLDPLFARLEATLASLGGAATGGGEEEQGDEAGPDDTSAAAGLADSVMRSLLARDVLHSPLSEIAARYPPWLDKAKASGTLSERDEARFVAQLGCVRRIMALYQEEEAEERARAAAVAAGGAAGPPTDRFPALFAALTEMQSHGQPPQEIVDELAPGLAFDADGLPVMEGGGAGGGGLLGGLLPGGGGQSGPDTCSLM